MVDWNWLTTTGAALLMVLLSALGIYLFLLVSVRLVGLRSFAKISSFDFAITVAIGTVLASTVLTRNPPLLRGFMAVAVLFGIQYVVSRLRRGTTWMPKLVDNQALLLMAGSEVISANLDRARMTEDDLKSKLRMAGITHPEQVAAVVMETTGDVAVLKVSDDEHPLDLDLFTDVRDADRLRTTEDFAVE